MIRTRLVFRSAWVLAAICASLAGTSTSAEDAIPKQVHLIVDGNRLIASNVRFSRFDEVPIFAQERIVRRAEGEGVIVIVTSQRFLGYGVLSGWQTLDRLSSEGIEKVEAQDYAALVVTSRRLLNFNGQSGVWGTQKRRTSQ